MPNSIQIGRFDNDFAVVTPTGTTLAGAALLTAGINRTPAAAGQVAVRLPDFSAGPVIVHNNAGTATAATVFPPTALGTINGGSAGAAFSVAQNARAVFFPHPNGVDYTAILSA